MSRHTVIGAAGFVGTRLTEALKADGLDVYAPARGDSRLFGEDLGTVYYCAGLTADYLARPFDTIEAHVALIARLLKAARFDRLVYLSSTRLYDASETPLGREDEPLTLKPWEPRHLSDLSKALGENLCLTQAGGRAAVARLACVFDWKEGAPGFLSEWLQRARRERTIALDSASGFVRDYITLDDTVSAVRAIAASDEAEIVNVGSGENVSNAELAAVFEAAGWSISLARETERQAAAVCDVSRLARLGVTPTRVREAVAARLITEGFVEAG